jgi:peptidoglycan hydrolase CwlO-like protein
LNQKISRFESILELQKSLDIRIKDLNDKIDSQSKLIGDKIREGEKNNAEELTDLKEKLNPANAKDAKSTDKKSKNKKSPDKKKKSKKGQSENWIIFQILRRDETRI